MAILSTAVIATAEWTAGGYDYVLDIEEVAGSVDTNEVRVISPIVMRCGDENASPLPAVRVRSVSMRMRDEALYLQGRITEEGGNRHILNITRDAATIFRGFVDNRFQSYLAWHTNPEMELSAFDGLELLAGYPWLRAGNEIMRQVLFAIVDQTGLGLPLNIVMPWKHDGAAAGTEPPDALRWRSEDWLPQNATYLDALNGLCTAFNADFFQRGGEWWFVQRSTRGETLTVYPTDNTGTPGTATTYDPVYVAETTTLLRQSTEVIEHAPLSLITIEQEWIDRGLRNGGFELISTRFWNVNGGAIASPTGGWMMDTNGEYIEQEVGHTLMALSATRDKLVIHLDFSFVIDASASGTATVGNAFMDYLEVQLTEADGTILYDDGAGSWTGTQTYIQYPFLLASLAGTTVEESDLTHTTPVPPSSPCKVKVKFIFQSNPNSDGDYINSLTVNRAWVGHARPEREDDIDRPDGFTYTQGNTLGGEHLEQSLILGDAYDRHLVPGVMQYYDGAGWQFTTDWDGLGQKFHKKRLDDLVAQLSARLPGYAFGHLWGEEVDILSTIAYDPTAPEVQPVFLPVFEERVIHPVGKHSVRTAAYRLLGATAYVPQEFETMYVAIQNNAVGATNNFVAKVYRDENNVGSWTYDLLNISQATYGANLNGGGAILVDEADNIIFLRRSDGVIYSFELDGTPIAQVWSGSAFSDWCINTIDNKIYFNIRTDVPSTGRTVTIYSMDYDGSNQTQIWTATYGFVTTVAQMAYDQGFIYYLISTSFQDEIFARVNVSTGSYTTIYTGWNDTVGSGPGSASISLGYYFSADSGRNEMHRMEIPSVTNRTLIKEVPDYAITDIGVAIDQIASRVYFTSGQREISRCALDGTSTELVIDFPATGAGTYVFGISLGR